MYFRFKSHVLTWGLYLSNDGIFSLLLKTEIFSHTYYSIITVSFSISFSKYLLSYYSLQDIMKSITTKTGKIQFLPLRNLPCSIVIKEVE